jgi:hypothetical protein
MGQRVLVDATECDCWPDSDSGVKRIVRWPHRTIDERGQRSWGRAVKFLWVGQNVVIGTIVSTRWGGIRISESQRYVQSDTGDGRRRIFSLTRHDQSINHLIPSRAQMAVEKLD